MLALVHGKELSFLSTGFRVP